MSQWRWPATPRRPAATRLDQPEVVIAVCVVAAFVLLVTAAVETTVVIEGLIGANSSSPWLESFAAPLTVAGLVLLVASLVPLIGRPLSGQSWQESAGLSRERLARRRELRAQVRGRVPVEPADAVAVHHQALTDTAATSTLWLWAGLACQQAAGVIDDRRSWPHWWGALFMLVILVLTPPIITRGVRGARFLTAHRRLDGVR